jgi:hypothetical protein
MDVSPLAFYYGRQHTFVLRNAHGIPGRSGASRYDPAGAKAGRLRRRRMGRLALLIASLAALAVGGCSTGVGPSQAELKARWEAQNVFPAAYKSDLLAFLRTYINDPTRLRGTAVSQPQRKTYGLGERYVACVRYQERKSDGQYAASKDGAAVYVSGKLDRFFDDPKEMTELCRGVAFQPFPELERLAR